jgi:replicative DNA helicase
MSIGLKLLACLIDSEEGINDYARLRLTDEYFAGESEAELFGFVTKHVASYGKLPSREACRENGFKMLPKDLPEPPQYYADKCKERYVHLKLKGLLTDVETDLNEDRPHEALSRVTDALVVAQTFAKRNRLFDFAAEGDSIIRREYREKQLDDGEKGLMLGWPTFDNMTNGLMGGDLVSIVGRPGAGKTYLALHGANSAWLQGKVPLVISMEMKPLQIMQRTTSMLARVPITELKRGAMPLVAQRRWQETLRSFTTCKQPYWIVDGALTATVSDILLLARQLKPHAVFIDGAYLLRSDNPRAARWEKLTDNAERIKAELAEGLDVPVVITYQFNRNVKKGTKAGGTDLGDIAYTDAIGQLSSVVLGMLQEDSVETLTQRTVEVLKGRNGETGSFNIRWTFDRGPAYMDFSEVKRDSGDLNFV